MQEITNILNLIDANFGGSQWFVLALLGTGLFFTLYLRFPQIRFFGHAWKVLSGKYDNKNDKGDTSHFQSLSTALSGTVGTGNIAGVALAIHLGGPSALFWMLVTAFLGMTTKMVEVTLSHKYREQTADGTMAGGPMYYMKNRLHMRWLAILFAIATIFSVFGTGCLPQINSISNAMFATFGLKYYITGAVLSVLLGLIIIGGIKRIAKVAERLVPLMAMIYIGGAISVLVYNYENIWPALVAMFSGIVSGTAATGGFMGATLAWAFNRGVNRGLFSNEAGQGSAPIAHAAAKTKEPVSEGMVALLEPFLDTILICFLTGMVLLSSGAWNEKFDNCFQQTDVLVLAGSYNEADPAHKAQVSQHIMGFTSLPLFTGRLEVVEGSISTNEVTLLHARSFADGIQVYTGNELFTGSLPVTNGRFELAALTDSRVYLTGQSLLHSAPLSTEAFKKGVLGDWGQFIVPICLLLFAFTTAVAWAYYGDRAVTFLWGTKYVNYFRIVYVLGFFIASFTDTTIVWIVSGITVALMTVPNLLGILLLHKEVKESVNDYWNRIRK